MGSLMVSHQIGIAQSKALQGIAIYKTAMAMEFEGDDQMSEVEQAAIQQQLSKAMQREYTLSFNGTESNYKENEALDKKEVAQSGDVMIKVASGSSLAYKDTKKKRYLEDADLFGKSFLIDDQLEILDWEITGEKKQIGRYECQQAKYTREARMMEVDSENGEPTEVVRNVDVVAWFTTEIPVNHGPDDFWGLPGLILEVSNGSQTIICTKVTLNPEKPVEIKLPKGGKSITREKFAELREEKMKEMMQQFQGNDGERRVIRVGG